MKALLTRIEQSLKEAHESGGDSYIRITVQDAHAITKLIKEKNELR